MTGCCVATPLESKHTGVKQLLNVLQGAYPPAYGAPPGAAPPPPGSAPPDQSYGAPPPAPPPEAGAPPQPAAVGQHKSQHNKSATEQMWLTTTDAAGAAECLL